VERAKVAEVVESWARSAIAKNRDDACAEVGPGESILCHGSVHWGQQLTTTCVCKA